VLGGHCFGVAFGSVCWLLLLLVVAGIAQQMLGVWLVAVPMMSKRMPKRMKRAMIASTAIPIFLVVDVPLGLLGVCCGAAGWPMLLTSLNGLIVAWCL